MTYNNIIYETDERLAFITLNRPEKLNALSHALRGEVYDAMKEAEADPAIGVIILKGAGRAFSAGYDLAPNPDEAERLRKPPLEDAGRRLDPPAALRLVAARADGPLADLGTRQARHRPRSTAGASPARRNSPPCATCA